MKWNPSSSISRYSYLVLLSVSVASRKLLKLKNFNKFQWNLNLMLIFDSIFSLCVGWEGKTLDHMTISNLKVCIKYYQTKRKQYELHFKSTRIQQSNFMSISKSCFGMNYRIWIKWYRWHLYRFIYHKVQTEMRQRMKKRNAKSK